MKTLNVASVQMMCERSDNQSTENVTEGLPLIHARFFVGSRRYFSDEISLQFQESIIETLTNETWNYD